MQKDARVPDSGEYGPTGWRLELSGRRRILWQALNEKDLVLGNLYISAIMILSNEAVPSRTALAAHGLREMIKALPKYLGLALIGTDTYRLGDRVKDMARRWGNLCNQTKCYRDGEWSGEIDQRLKDFLHRTDAFYAAFKENRPTRECYIEHTIRGLEPSGRALPEPLEAREVKHWKSIWEYFIERAHDIGEPDIAEFEQKLNALESFLHDRMVLGLHVDLSEIDRLISEVESDD